MKILVVVPAYNEEKNILEVSKNLEKLKTISKYSIDYIVINDGSTDNTKLVCERNNIPVINLIRNLGIGGAVQTGYKYALKKDYDIVIQFDGDGQHDYHYIDNLITEIGENKYSMVIGSRYIGGLSNFQSTKMRRVGIKFLSNILFLTTGKRIYDVTSGFRAIDKKVIELFSQDYPNDYPEPETIALILKKGYTVKEIPVKMHERLNGSSSITPLKSIYYMIKVSYSIIVRSIIESRNK